MVVATHVIGDFVAGCVHFPTPPGFSSWGQGEDQPNLAQIQIQLGPIVR